MKKFIDNPKNLAPELQEGFSLAYNDKVALRNEKLVCRARPKDASKVADALKLTNRPAGTFLHRRHLPRGLGATTALLVVTSAVLGAVTAPITPQEREAATAFFAARDKEVAFRESGRQLWLANHDLGVEFLQTTNGLQLSRLVGAQFGGDFLTPDSDQSASGCWQLVLRRDRGRDGHEITVSSRNAAAVSVCSEGNASARALRLRWQGLAVASEPNALDVEVTVTLRAGVPLSRWRINVTNRSKTYGLWDVVFPILRLQPIGGNPRTNFLALPRMRGAVTANPFGMPRVYFSPYGTKPTGLVWPGHVNMQFQALYDESGSGLYLGVHDGTGCKKQFDVAPSPDASHIEHAVHHFPADLGYPGVDYRMAYDVCIGPFRGDWYDACQIYRRWAIGQPWCGRGPLATRSDVPRWFKESPVMLGAANAQGDARIPELRDRATAMLRLLGGELPIHWTDWIEHVPGMTAYNKPGSAWKVPDKRSYPCVSIHVGNYPRISALPAFSPACESLRKAGGHVLAFICSHYYDPGLNENAPFAAQAKPNAARTMHGAIQIGDMAWRMCPHTPWWQQRLAETSAELIRREHVGGFYLDTFYGGHVAQCFDTGHGHSHGGGAEEYLGDKRLAMALRTAAKSADPEAVLCGENSCETAIELLDGFCYHRLLFPGMAPLFATVYRDYITRYGEAVDPNSDNFHAQCAALLTEGAQIGRLFISFDDLTAPKYATKIAFLQKLVRQWRLRPEGRYLAYGQLLRPLAFTRPDPMPQVSCTAPSYAGFESRPISLPALQSAVFRTEEGGLGVFIVNIADKPVQCAFELRPGRYPLSSSRIYRVRRAGEPAGQTSRCSGQAAFSGQIPARDVVFVEVLCSPE